MKEDDKHVLIQGAGGGKKQKSPPPPKEAPNTLQSAATARVLDLLAYGPIKGVVGGAKGVYLDDTVVQNEDGSFNFEGTKVSFRNGEPDQDIIEGFNEVSSIREINTEIRYGVPVSRTVTNKDATSVLVTVKLGGLLSRNAKSGDTNPYEVPFSIAVRKDGAVYDSISTSIQGKTTSAYERTYRLNLPPSDSSDVTVIVQRTNKESESQDIVDAISWSKIAEVVDAKHNYPGCALVGFEVDARLFGETLPSRKYLTDLSIVQIPSNYNPYTRQYTGLWDGSMKWDWTDNPAWCFYDLATHPIIGAGVAEVNKFALYEIGKYCDELVDDGFGGKEPRFTCNTIFTDTADAINALNTLASVFRGMAYWGSDTVEVVADMPGSVRRIISPSDVVEGAFEYTGTSLKERHSVVLVQWNDPLDNYDAKPEVVELPEAIAAIGYKETEVTAVACTSRGQARRLGLWLLYSEHYETQMVTFEVTVKNADLRPGDFIAVSDPYRAGARLSGKLLEVDRVGQWVKLDALPSEVVVGWDLTVEGDDKSLTRSKITAVNTELIMVRVASLSPKVFVGAGFSLTSGAMENQQFRVLSVTENDRHNYTISASEHHPGKYDYVEKGLKLPEIPTTTMRPSGVLTPPSGLSGESFTKLVAGILHQNATISWEPSPDPRATKSVLDGKGPNDIAYKTLYTGDGTSFDVENIDPGSWQFRVRAFSETFGMSAWYEKTIHLADGLQPIPPISLVIVPQTLSVSITPVKQGYTVSEFEFWRSSVPLTQEFIESNARHLGITSGTFYDDTVTFDTEYYYYVRAVNSYGTSSFVAGQTRTLADVEDILGAIASEANEGPLGQWFNQEFDKISGVGPGSVNARIGSVVGQVEADLSAITGRTDTLDQSVAGLQSAVADLEGNLQSSVEDINDAIESVDSRLTGRIENVAGDIAGLGTSISDLYGQVAGLDNDLQGSVSDLNSQLTQLETQISDIIGSEDWAADQVYLIGSLVRFDGALYRAEQDVPDGTPITSADYWRKVGDYASIGEALAALTIQVTDMQVHVDEITGTQSSIIETQSALIATTRPERSDGEKADSLRGWQTQSSIIQRDRVEASDKAVLAERLLLIDAQIGDTSSQLSSLEQAFASETEATAGRIDQLAVDLGTTTAGLQQEIQTRATETSALASDVQSIQAALGDVASVEAFDALVVEVEQLGDDITGVAQSVTDLTSRITDTETGMGVISTAVEGLQTSVGLIEGELSAQASDITALGVSIGEVGDLAEQADGKADDALLGLGDKADASAVQALTIEVEQIGDTTAANSGLITQLESSVSTAQDTADDALAGLGDKADSSAVQSLTTEVERIGEDLSTASQSITNLGSTLDTVSGVAEQADSKAGDALQGLSTKADASALQALTTEVGQVGADVTVNAEAITDLGSRIETAETGIAGNADAVEALTTEVSEIDGKVAAAAQRLTALETEVGETSAALSVLQQAFSDESEATASQLTALATELGTTSAGLASEIQTRASETAALASDVQSMQAVLEGVATSEALQALTVEVEQLGSDITSVALSVTSLTGRIESTETGLQGVSDAVSGLQTSISDIEGELTAQASDITDLGVSIGQAADLAEQADGKADNALLGLGDKADATAVQGLTVEVQQLGEDVLANSGSITELNSSVEAAQQVAGDALAGLVDKADASALQALTTEVEQIGEDLSTASQSITNLDASLQVVGTTAQGAADLAAQADGKADDALSGLGDKADSSAVQALTVEVNQIGEDLSAASQSITDLGSSLSAVSDVADGAAQAADDALAGLLTKADASAVQSLTTNVEQIGEDVSANSGAIMQLEGRIESAETGIVGNADAVESLTTEVESIDGRVTANTNSITAQTSTIENVESGLEAVSSSVTSLTTRVEETEDGLTATTQKVDGIYSTLKPVMAGSTQVMAGSTQVKAGVYSVWSAISDSTRALSSQVTTLSAEVGDTKAAVEQVSSVQADVNGNLEAMWGVKLQLNSKGEYVTAGIGLGIDNSSGVAQSTFIVQADKFIVQNGLEGAGQAAFAVVDDKVVIRSAFIQDASINMAKIGGDLYSDDYVEEVSGWRLQRSGQFEINSSIPGQGRIQISNKGMRVYDEFGQIRVKLGDLR